jgi:hypothetical protein
MSPRILMASGRFVFCFVLVACGGSPKPDPMVGKYVGPLQSNVNETGQSPYVTSTEATIEVVEEDELIVITENCRYTTTRNDDESASMTDAICRFKPHFIVNRTEIVRSGTAKLQVDGKLLLDYRFDFIDRSNSGEFFGAGDVTVSFVGWRQ